MTCAEQPEPEPAPGAEPRGNPPPSGIPQPYGPASTTWRKITVDGKTRYVPTWGFAAPQRPPKGVPDPIWKRQLQVEAEGRVEVFSCPRNLNYIEVGPRGPEPRRAMLGVPPGTRVTVTEIHLGYGGTASPPCTSEIVAPSRA